MLGSISLTDLIEIPINGLFVMGLTFLIALGVYFLMFRSRSA
jgi:urea transport system permease protein